jgi:LacI family transcriptional regulator, gluconate utilization system Gnt-I transcriptional repressor
VSSATVSRYFNAPQMLSPRTAERVRAVVQKSGYIPNLVAGALASKRSRLIAAAIPTISQSIFASTIQALTDSLAEEGYSVMLGLTGVSDENVQRQLLSMIGRRPDGIILTGTVLDPASRNQLKATGIPTIETWDLPKDPIDLVVGFSHEAVGTALAQRALALGRRRALVLSATGLRALTRRDSFARTMLAAGAHEPIVATFAGTTTYGRARRAAAVQLDDRQQHIDVVVCTSDWGAHGVLDELRQRGIRVPEDIAVIGFGDLEFAAELTPSLTTIKIDGAVIGKHAARFFMQRARGQRIEQPQVDIGFSLIVRESG